MDSQGTTRASRYIESIVELLKTGATQEKIVLMAQRYAKIIVEESKEYSLAKAEVEKGNMTVEKFLETIRKEEERVTKNLLEEARKIIE
jgi:hypothetical protein